MADLSDALLELGSRLSQLSPSSTSAEPERYEGDALWRQLVEAGQRYATACEEVDEALLARDRLIIETSEAGFSRREVARAAGVSPGRVQQILDPWLRAPAG
jgi:hypothetical protein